MRDPRDPGFLVSGCGLFTLVRKKRERARISLRARSSPPVSRYPVFAPEAKLLLFVRDVGLCFQHPPGFQRLFCCFSLSVILRVGNQIQENHLSQFCLLPRNLGASLPEVVQPDRVPDLPGRHIPYALRARTPNHGITQGQLLERLCRHWFH